MARHRGWFGQRFRLELGASSGFDLSVFSPPCTLAYIFCATGAIIYILFAAALKVIYELKAGGVDQRRVLGEKLEKLAEGESGTWNNADVTVFLYFSSFSVGVLNSHIHRWKLEQTTTRIGKIDLFCSSTTLCTIKDLIEMCVLSKPYC